MNEGQEKPLGMSEVLPDRKKETEDNARKFIVEKLNPDFLKEQGASSFEMTTDWIATAEDTEQKVVCKKFENGERQFLVIAKVTKDGSRSSEKKKISEEEYQASLASSKKHSQKKRSEFTYLQDAVSFNMKYDEFADQELHILEVDANDEKERSLFNPSAFPVALSEVTGDMRYYGYRVADL